ncbi:hypothetical protein JTE90_025762 [Oedothorax gibbosus]|uniref:Uncharacterized protein n=1 Tax=Oedothorax gibbosus TaxID=931172 RepID=A0AAV6U5T6_9ARAC|nr:hypothetical protein JTE90_025762 [Oedothorax gibbosus]
MELFKPPPEISFTCGNVAENWKRWIQKFNNFMLATEKNEKPDANKIAILLNLLGDEGVKLFNTFKFEKTDTLDEAADYSVVLKKFEDYYAEEEPACEFGEQEESLIRDRVVLGIRNLNLQERLLRETDLSLTKASEFVRAAETSKEQFQSMKGLATSVNAVTINSRKRFQPKDSPAQTTMTARNVVSTIRELSALSTRKSAPSASRRIILLWVADLTTLLAERSKSSILKNTCQMLSCTCHD